MSDAGSNGSKSSGIQVIDRAVNLLRALKETPGGMTPAELSERLDLPRTTIHRILAALEEAEMVAAGPGSRARYRLGAEIMRLASSSSRDLVSLIHPWLVELSSQLTETVDLSILDGSLITFIDQVDAPHRLRAASAVGESFPLHSCAPGKALLATLSPGRLAEILPSRLAASTQHTITSVDDLRQQLEHVRKTGVAYDYEEQNEGICAAGIAVVVAGVQVAISVPMPAQRFTGREDECATALLDLRGRIEAADWS